jgi:outer membrane lipase/esterase
MRLLNRAMGRRILGACMLAVLASCGGGGDGDQSPKLQISRIVSFGDSLSDVGSYNTTALAATASGSAGLGGTANSGKFTVNSAGAKNWIELLAAQYGVAAPCPAETGLDSNAEAAPGVANPLFGFAQARAEAAECFAYGQGGARVTDPVGPGNKNLPGEEGLLGQLTTPLVTQVARHLAKGTGGDAFASDELVLVLAGGNDLFINAALVGAAAIDVPTAVGFMATAGTELANLVKNQMVAKGASHVVVVTLPDVSLTPSFLGTAGQGLALALSESFNGALTAGLADAGSAVLVVDAFTQSQEQAADPAQFDLSNVTTPACDLSDEGPILFATSLVCNANTLIAGDTSKFLYADGVHPTPYGYKLLAQFVADRLVKAGLL